jgi:putative nucleotidyltransferase with HDIG domain
MNVLLAFPDEDVAYNLKSFLEENDFECSCVNSGKNAQLKIYKGGHDVICLGLDLQNHSGLIVLRYLLMNFSKIKILLFVPDEKFIEEITLRSKKIDKMLGSSGVFKYSSSFDKVLANLQESQCTYFGEEVNSTTTEVEETSSDKLFSSIQIDSFYSGKTTLLDIYVRLSSGRYIKILNKGSYFDQKRLDHYKTDKSVKELYFKTNEVNSFLNALGEVAKSIENSKNVHVKKKYNVAKVIGQFFISEAFSKGINNELKESSISLCQSIYSSAKKDPNLLELLSIIEVENYDILEHSFQVAFLASVICNTMQWSSVETKRVIVLGSIFHDIGKLKLPKEMQQVSGAKVDERFSEVYKSHCELGKDMLVRSGVEEKVIQIVYQHHEYQDGSGFPNGITKSHIYPLAQVVGLADYIVSQSLITNKNIHESIIACIGNSKKLRLIYHKDIMSSLTKLVDS